MDPFDIGTPSPPGSAPGTLVAPEEQRVTEVRIEVIDDAPDHWQVEQALQLHAIGETVLQLEFENDHKDHDHDHDHGHGHD